MHTTNKIQNYYKIKKYQAFTLAEVLITLGIIGVVAAITIPVILNNVSNQEIVSKYKEDFSIFNQAAKSLNNDNGGVMENTLGSSNVTALTNLSKYIQFSKTCSTNPYTEGCADYVGNNASNLKMLDNTAFSWSTLFSAYPGAVMQNGTIMIVQNLDTTCKASFIGTNVGVCSIVTFDVNGAKSPNIFGRDIFRVHITADGVYPWGSINDRGVTNPAVYGCKESGASGNGESCGARILREGAINY